MKPYIKKTVLSLVLVFSFVIQMLSFSACSSKNETVLEYKGYTIDKTTYSYWFDVLEEYYMSYYSDIKDTAEFWNKEYADGESYGEYMNKTIKNQISCYLISQYLFDEYKLKLTDDAIDEIDETINSQIEYYGSKAAFNKELEKYGINVGKLRKIYMMEEKFITVKTYLYDTKTGIEKPTEEDKKEYYQSNYARINYLMVLRNKEYAYDDDGKHITDANGFYTYVDLTEEQIKEKTAYANKVFEEVKNGADIKKYIKKDNPDSVQENGYYVTADDYVIHTADIINATFEMEIGSTVLVSNEDAYFILQRYELIPGAYNLSAESANFYYFETYVAAEKFNKKFEELMKEVVKQPYTDTLSVINN